MLDADALNLLADRKLRRDDWILTPHPGEAGRLLGTSSAMVQGDRLAALNELCQRYGGTVVLKGRGTLIGREGCTPVLIDRGNPGMATAGMGDVLTGLTAGLAAQTGSTDLPTAAAAAFVHAAAGDAAAARGERGLLASDLLEHFRPWLNPSLLKLADPAATRALGNAVAQAIVALHPVQFCIYLEGELGAGQDCICPRCAGRTGP